MSSITFSYRLKDAIYFIFYLDIIPFSIYCMNTMQTLLLKLKDGKIIKGHSPMHFMLAEENEIDFDDIVDVGFITKGRFVWCNRKPH